MKPLKNRIKSFPHWLTALIVAGLSSSAGAVGPTLADAPLYSTVVVPANVVLDISVEWPTGDDDPYNTSAYSTYTTATEFTGYWNPNFCYTYDATNNYFTPQSAASSHGCSGKWSGNFLNWSLTQTIDPLRQALTGGYRSIDTASNTVLQKSYSDSQVSSGGFPNKTLSTTALVSGATPFGWSSLSISNRNTGKQFYFSSSAPEGTGNTLAGTFTLTTYPGDTSAASTTPVTTVNNPTCYTAGPANGNCTSKVVVTPSATDATQTTVTTTCKINSSKTACSSTSNATTTKTLAYSLYAAAQVCKSGVDSSDSRCRGYPYGSASPTVYKPTGLMQKYAAETSTGTDSIRYSIFGYLNDNNLSLDGGVMRARMKSLGPYMANPGQAVQLNNATNNSTTKTSAEWSATDGTFISNPDSTDATNFGASGSNSGVINYLNQFGFAEQGYKDYDPVGELYYAATRYYRNLTSVTSYTSTATATTKAGFPAITTTTGVSGDDPIAYTCSPNYIVGIGDIHTHADANLPGRTWTPNKEPTTPAQVTADTAVNSVTATNYVGTLEHKMSASAGGGTSDYQLATGIGNAPIDTIAASTGGWCCNNHSFLMAGLAYDIHTRDIRTDITNKNNAITVSTFWLDVMENNDYHEKNQFWLTAKYGGFDTSQTDTNGNALFSIVGQTASTTASSAEYTYSNALPTSWWNSTGHLCTASETGCTSIQYVDSAGVQTTANYKGGNVDDHGNLRPDQYYQASNPAAMISGLNTAFAKIAASIPSGTSNALGLGSGTLASGSVNYVTNFASDWSGDVAAKTLTVTQTGGVITTTSTTAWDSKTWLPPTTTTTNPSVLTYDTRIIATSSSKGAGHGVRFRESGHTGAGGNVTSTQQATLVSPSWASATTTQVLNYLRGDQTNESTSKFRQRLKSVLGDITNSEPQVVGAPSLPYSDAPLNPGYSTFKTTYTNTDGSSKRSTVLYVAANDGMMHAFDATTTTGGTGGKELFAYVPSSLFTANTDSAGSPVGLGSLTANPLTHHFMVDASPTVIDVDFDRVGTTWSSTATTTYDWHSVLIGGLGKGGGASGSTVGGGFFALDVTDPTAITSESALAGKVLWETDPTVLTHMGYGYEKPLVIKTKKYGWTVVLTSGYDNDDGKGYFYLVNPKDGSLYESPIATGVGSTTSPAGMARVAAAVNNEADFTADAIYAGDLLGNVWRVDLTYTSGNGSATKFATLADAGGTAQPVTTRPVIGFDPTSLKRYVFVGTGSLLSDNELVNANTETFYAFQDGDNSAFNTTGLPLTRSDLTLDDPASGVTAANLASSKGFYIDLAAAATNGTGTQASAERINIQPQASDGIVGFAANLYGQNICLIGTSRLFGLNFDSGSSNVGLTLLRSSGSPSTAVSYLSYTTGVITNVTLANTSSGVALAVGLDTTPRPSTSIPPSSTVVADVLGKPSANLTRINWREVPQSQ